MSNPNPPLDRAGGCWERIPKLTARSMPDGGDHSRCQYRGQEYERPELIGLPELTKHPRATLWLPGFPR